jgi:hypothetical protein
MNCRDSPGHLGLDGNGFARDAAADLIEIDRHIASLGSRHGDERRRSFGRRL